MKKIHFSQILLLIATIVLSAVIFTQRTAPILDPQEEWEISHFKSLRQGSTVDLLEPLLEHISEEEILDTLSKEWYKTCPLPSYGYNYESVRYDIRLFSPSCGDNVQILLGDYNRFCNGGAWHYALNSDKNLYYEISTMMQCIPLP